MIVLFEKVARHIIGFFVVHVLGRILKYIPGEQEACNKKMRRDPRFLAFIPDHFKTQEIYERVTEKYPSLFIYVPDRLKTQEMCNKAVKEFPLAYVPADLKTKEMCKKAVEKDTNILKNISDQYITQEMGNEARGCPWLKGHVPDHFKTQEMCTRALEVCPWSLEHILDCFVTQQQIKLWCDHDYYCSDGRLLKWYEDHKKRKVQKASNKRRVNAYCLAFIKILGLVYVRR